jgi:hypothetical protein
MIRVRRYCSTSEKYSIWDDITSWCFSQCGIPGETGDWNYLAQTDYMDFYFKDSKYAELFILKWM